MPLCLTLPDGSNAPPGHDGSDGTKVFPGTKEMIIASLERIFACDWQSAELNFLVLDK